MPESQDYGTVARYFIDSLPGLGKRATKHDKGPFFTFYRGDFRGAWTNYRDDVTKLKAHNDSKGVKPSFCKAYTWVEVEFVISHMISFKEIVRSHGNERLEVILTETFEGWDNVHIGKELREEINNYANPLPLAPNELPPPVSANSSQSSGLSLSQAPSVNTPMSSQGFSPTRPPSSQTTPSRPSGKRPLFASPGSSQDSGVHSRTSTQSKGVTTGKRTQLVAEDIRTATSVLWTQRSLAMGATYHLELIDGLVDELLALRPHFESQAAQVPQSSQAPTTPNRRTSDGDDDDVSETEYGDDDEGTAGNKRVGPSSRHAPRGRYH